MRYDRHWNVAFAVEDPREEPTRFFRGLSLGVAISAAFFWIPAALAAVVLIA